MTRAGKRRAATKRHHHWHSAKAKGTEMGEEEEGEAQSPPLHVWYLVDKDDNKKLRLPRTMLFLGRDDCDINIQSDSIDRRHAVLTFDLYLCRFKVKDLSTANGTYVNEVRIEEQVYVTLFHMDTIRLGHDSRVYHMEQGELCEGGSPPPPPLPLQPPPTLKEANNNDGAPLVADDSGVELPVWVSFHGDQLAECQGCIAEQKLRHTCTHAHAQHEQRKDHDHHCHFKEDVDCIADRGASEDPQEPEPDISDKPKRSRNTWPRKRTRQSTHVAYIFDADGGDSDSVGPIMVENGSNYFVSADDSVCDRGKLAEEYALSRSGSVQRILRNSTLPLPPELETVRKGTPLYGQPSWWGEDTPRHGEAESAQTQKRKSSQSSPTSLPPTAQPTADDPHHHKDPDPTCTTTTTTAMDIASQDKNPGLWDRTSRSLTPSLSKNTLALSPGLSSAAVQPGEDAADKGSHGQEESIANSNPALSFTVEFSEDKKKPKLKKGASLSEFVPPKLRNSLSSSHARLAEKMSSAKGGRESGGSGTNSEERELSPVKPTATEEAAGAVQTAGRGKSLRRSYSGHGSTVASLRTAELVSTEKIGTERRTENFLQDGEKTGPQKSTTDTEHPPPISLSSTATTTSTTTIKINRQKTSSTTSTAATSVHTMQYSNSTAYLIDRMFASSTTTSQDSTLQDPDPSDSAAVSTEHSLYKEAKRFDRESHRGISAPRYPGKPPLNKQKSLGDKASASGSTPVKTLTTGTGSKALFSKGSPARSASLSFLDKENAQDLQLQVFQGSSPVDDREDNVSDAGTYTIEADEDREEEMKARQEIDEVFGVREAEAGNLSFERPVIGSWEKLTGGPGDKKGGQRGGEENEEEEVETPRGKGAGASNNIEKKTSGAYSKDWEDVPPWISQLESLKSTRRSTSSSQGTDREEAAGKALADDSSKKPPQGAASRRRPGTGRRLPSIPTGSDHSPVSSEHSSRLLDNSPDSLASALNGSIVTRLENGHGNIESPSSSVRCFVSGSIKTSRSISSPCGSDDSGRRILRRPPSKSGSVSSRSSLDSELMLRKTDNVTAAVESKMGFSRNSRVRDDRGSDADLSSSASVVNGNEEKIKLRRFDSPRESTSRRVTKDKNTPRAQNMSSSSLKSLTRSGSEQKPPISGGRSARGSGGASLSSNYGSQTSLDQSFRSSVSDIRSEADKSLSRPSSGNKGAISMAKTNRAFTLRRARADSTEKELDRSRASASSRSAASSRRSSSLHSLSRTSYSDNRGAGRSEIGRRTPNEVKLRENSGATRTRERSVPRADGSRRNSLNTRRTGTPSSVNSPAASTLSYSKKERNVHTPKTQLRSSHKDLSITGIRSQPGSRSNSPKSAELMAWKRRKEYDPRKAVAEAKASKGKDTKPKPKVQPSTLFKQRLTRSVSLTNTAELSLVPSADRHNSITRDSPSSVDCLSLRGSAGMDGEVSLRRAFIPVCNALRNDRLSHSADEEDTGISPKSQDLSSRATFTPTGILRHRSAFTPPLSKLQTPSPEPLSRRLVLVNVDFEDVGVPSATSETETPRRSTDLQGTPVTSPRESYDSLIVSSIYQLSLKLKGSTDKTLSKLREQQRVSITPSPADEFLDHQTKSEIPAWKSANQELAGVLKNMRRMEHHLHLIDQVLFPEEGGADLLGMSSTDKEKYCQELQRIRGELAGFQPIDNPPPPDGQEPASPEMDQLSKSFEFNS